MDDRKWQSLNQLLEDISDKNSEFAESVQLLSQLVLELESELSLTTSGNNTNLQLQQEETSLMNRNEEFQ